VYLPTNALLELAPQAPRWRPTDGLQVPWLRFQAWRKSCIGLLTQTWLEQNVLELEPNGLSRIGLSQNGLSQNGLSQMA